MADKLKINVTARTAEILEKDAEGFEFLKSDGRTLNKNALVTKLIVNYHERFRKETAALSDYLIKTIGSAAHLTKNALAELCRTIAAHIYKREAAPLAEKFNHTVSVKPTRESEALIDYIERYELDGSSLSEYFRNMFSSYAALPQDEREKVIFRPQYEALERAIAHKKRAYITTRRGRDKGCEIAPYRIAASKEELHCYLLAAQGSTCIPLRLSRIVTVTELGGDAEFSEEQLTIFSRMLAYGPQFHYARQEEEVLVQFTAYGMELFQKLYVHRPVPVRIENNNYYFACSHQQLLQYLVRFGKDAYVVYPSSLRDRIQTFFRLAQNRYTAASKHFAAIAEKQKR